MINMYRIKVSKNIRKEILKIMKKGEKLRNS